MIWFWLNMPLAAVFFAAWVAVPLWIVFRHQGHAAKPVTVPVPASARTAGPAELPVAVAPQRARDLAGV
jgi:hypothetical protein